MEIQTSSSAILPNLLEFDNLVPKAGVWLVGNALRGIIVGKLWDAQGDRPGIDFKGSAADSEMVLKQFALILSVDSGPFAGSKLVVPTGESRTVGRTSRSDLATEDVWMSGLHFSIHCDGDLAEIRDMGSMNKTYVNGVSIVTLKLSPKDRIKAGKTLFSVSWEAPPEDDNSLKSDPISPLDSAIPVNLSENRPLDEIADRKLAEAVQIADMSAKSDLRPKPDPTSIPDFASGPAHYGLPNKRKNFSPFDSVDQSFASEDDSGEKLSRVDSGPAKISVRDFNSPFDDSVAINITIPEKRSQADSEFDASRNAPVPKAFRRLKRHPSDRNDYDFSQIVTRLRIQNPCRIVAHFQKIGEKVPHDLQSEPVIPRVGQGNEFFPVLIEREKWQIPKMLAITNRLVMADGIMLVIVNESLNANEALQNLAARGAPGFSAPNGLLAWFWPSQIYALAESLSDSALSELFGNEIEGIVAAVPQIENELFAFANQNVAELLQEFGFSDF